MIEGKESHIEMNNRKERVKKHLTVVMLFLLCFCVTPAWAKANVELTGAVLAEQNVTFAVVIVKSAFITDRSAADAFIEELKVPFGGIPVLLMAQDEKGTPTYYGRPDLAQFMSTVPVENIPWKKYMLSYGK